MLTHLPPWHAAAHQGLLCKHALGLGRLVQLPFMTFASPCHAGVGFCFERAFVLNCLHTAYGPTVRSPWDSKAASAKRVWTQLIICTLLWPAHPGRFCAVQQPAGILTLPGATDQEWQQERHQKLAGRALRGMDWIVFNCLHWVKKGLQACVVICSSVLTSLLRTNLLGGLRVMHMPCMVSCFSRLRYVAPYAHTHAHACAHTHAHTHVHTCARTQQGGHAPAHLAGAAACLLLHSCCRAALPGAHPLTPTCTLTSIPTPAPPL